MLVFFVTFLAFPFYWMLITTFKTTQDLYNTANNPYMFNDPPTLHHLQVLFDDTQYLQWLANTAFVGVAVVVITLVLAVPAGYALARMTGAWAQNLGIAIFLTYLVPPTILFIPFSRIIAMLGLQDFVVVAGARLPQLHGAILYLAADGFLQGDTARARGRGDDRRLEPARRVHQSGRADFVAGMLTAVIFAFTLVTQEFVYGVTFITSSASYTVSVGVPTFLVRGDVYFWGSMMGACLIASVPIAVIYNLFVDRFVTGFTVGAIK